ncbi:hypothetical protein Ddye_031183 [Dipteronia dyeriana]|uniref:Uncharacterized protein n=1 Tax=Dipteronia dyeriana TaxID=168575 RepID=A0AAD9WMC0_9ROSI|nr:hypothetical protein Ddye_031183 [Dipteronia dyeriana]
MPVGVTQKIEKLQRNFLWGDGIEKRKIHAIDWETICKSKAKEGLGIGRMLVKNNALLAKWVWRFGRLNRVLGCKDNMDFWNDIKVGVRPLKDIYPIMFALASANNREVRKFGYWRGLSWKWDFKLRRPPFDWEKDQ